MTQISDDITRVGRFMTRVSQNRFMFTVFDRMFGYLPAGNTVHTPYMNMVVANPRYDL